MVPGLVPPFGAGSELALRSILYIGKISSITAGANLGRGGPGRSGTRCGTAFLGLVPDLVPRPGTRCGTTFWGWNQRCGTRPGTRCGTTFSKNIPDLDYGLVRDPGTRCGTIFGTGTRDVVPPFWGWNERCGIRGVAQPFWAGTGSGTTAWYHTMVLDVVWGWNQRCGIRFGTF